MSIIRPRSEPLDPAETLLSAGVITTVALWLYAWTIYVLSLPTVFLAFTPALIFAGIFFARAPLRKALRDVEARHLLLSQILISLWCVVWLSFIVSYSGGGWSGDWFEHWERTRFFLERGSLETRFLGIYQLPARPPLANVITGALLTSTEVSFASYQLCSTLLSSLAFSRLLFWRVVLAVPERWPFFASCSRLIPSSCKTPRLPGPNCPRLLAS